MTRLILMRHARAAPAVQGMSDHARPLDLRGRRDAPRVALELANAGWAPDLALVSDAARTEETWAWMAEHFAVTPLALSPALYHGALDDLRAVVRARVDAERTVLALGHNPGWELAVRALTGTSLTLRPATAALLTHPLPWSEALARQDWRLAGVVLPSGA